MGPAADTGRATAPAEATREPPPGYLDLYKLAVEMADRVSSRRALANTFFLTINTGLAALLGDGNLRWYVSAAGIVLCVAWWALLKSYRDLNRAKFDVILELERALPARIYTKEWQLLKPDQPRGRFGAYRELGRIERVVPGVFALIYLAELIRQLLA